MGEYLRKPLEEMTSEERNILFENESMTLCRRDVNSMLDYETLAERVCLTPLPGASLGERAKYAVKRFFLGIKRNFINALYSGRNLHFESHEEYEDWRAKIAHRA